MRVRVFGEAQVRDRIAFEAVGAALEQDELGRPGAQVVLDLRARPRGSRSSLAPGGSGRFSFVPTRRARRRFRRAAPGAGIQVAAVLVEVGEQQIRIVLERVEHAVAVMRIDVDVSDALQAMLAAQHLDRDAAIVEHAEAGGVVARRMMQAGDRNECATRAAAA